MRWPVIARLEDSDLFVKGLNVESMDSNAVRLDQRSKALSRNSQGRRHVAGDRWWSIDIMNAAAMRPSSLFCILRKICQARAKHSIHTADLEPSEQFTIQIEIQRISSPAPNSTDSHHYHTMRLQKRYLKMTCRRHVT